MRINELLVVVWMMRMCLVEVGDPAGGAAARAGFRARILSLDCTQLGLPEKKEAKLILRTLFFVLKFATIPRNRALLKMFCS